MALFIGVELINVLKLFEEQRFPADLAPFKRRPGTLGHDDECTKLCSEKSDAFQFFVDMDLPHFEESSKIDTKSKN